MAKVKKRKKASVSPTQLTLKYLRKNGWSCQVVEHYNFWTKRRIDLFNWLDIVAIHPKHSGVMGVQTTTTSHANERLKKARGIPELKIWLKAGNPLNLITWTQKLAKTRSKRKTWVVTDREVTLEDLNDSSD